jgi:hypothetical protein
MPRKLRYETFRPATDGRTLETEEGRFIWTLHRSNDMLVCNVQRNDDAIKPGRTRMGSADG